MKMGKVEWGLAGLLFAASVIFFSTFGAQADGGTVQSSYTTQSSARSSGGPYRWDGRTFNDKSDLAIYFLQRLAREGITGVPSRNDDDEDEDDDNDHDGSDELVVRTEGVSNIDEDGARMEGEVDVDDSDEVRVWFEYGENRNDLDEETPKRSINTRTARITFQATVNGRDDNTVYYFRAVAEDEDGDSETGVIKSFRTDRTGSTDDDDTDTNEDEPDVTTDSATDIDEDSAQIAGDVDMNDFEDGIVFFVYGKDEGQVEDVADDFDQYDDIDEDGDDLQKSKVETGLDNSADYDLQINGLDGDTTYYYAIAVEYEDEDGDDTIILGDVESFTTD